MIKYPFNFDSENYEIFPKEIWKNKDVVFHGTTTYHSNSIESVGFQKQYAPYNIDYV
ncbi:MAG: hypothetical protein ACOYMA_17260 [Bacteroidia bacterium]